MEKLMNFSLGYNKVYKPEYLPGRVRFNQFFFFVGCGVLFAASRRYVSFYLWVILTGLAIC